MLRPRTREETNSAVVETMLRVAGLTKRFGEFTAVSDVAFQVSRGEIFGLLGPNGAGKSTIIRMICGLLRPTEGSIELDGVDVVRRPDDVKPRIGYMSQRFSLYRDLTVDENLQFYGRIYRLSRRALAARREAMVELTGIGPYSKRLAGKLSGGWQQRLALACCLLHEPRVVFLDEPTAGIDPVARRQLWDLLFSLSGEGTSFLVTTHYMDEAERCTAVGYLYQSKLMVMGQPKELVQLSVVRPAGKRWLHVECDQSTRAYVILRAMVGVESATIFGRAVHLLVNDAVDAEALGTRLEAEGINTWHVTAAEPSLEDVFVSLTEQSATKAPS